ncbi:hypothetical protein BRC95_12070 [Halobacteriales archaeon QS_5_68_33]|nr:MAG: hypothetical protein BRC95_12070 [Halobacteriales archaeon QS_5_68_33]
MSLLRTGLQVRRRRRVRPQRVGVRTGRRAGPGVLILPAVSLSRISPPRGGEYLHEVPAGSITHTVGCTDVPVFRRPVRRNPELSYNRPYHLFSTSS